MTGLTLCRRCAPARHATGLRALLWVTLVGAWLAGAAVADEPAAPDGGPQGQQAQTIGVAVPLAFDYPLLQQLLVSQLFTGEGRSRELLGDATGCSELVVSRPVLAPRQAQLELLADLDARLGVGTPGACATMFTWRGRIGVLGTPQTRNQGKAVGFLPERVWLLDAADRPVTDNRLQQVADASIRGLLDRFTVDLTPQLESVGALLPDVLPHHSRQQIQALLASLQLGELQVGEDALNAQVVFEVEPLSSPPRPERALTEEEFARWEQRWQAMDALLVLAVKHYAAATELRELRDALLEALIESRYRLRDALVAPTDADRDPVRDWFLQSWQTLAPVLRRIGATQPEQAHLLLLGVIASTDALAALDQLGPGIGLDISADGLRRLARMIESDTGQDQLLYSPEEDPQLQRLLRESLDTPPPPSAWRLDFSLFSKAAAAGTRPLDRWAPQREDLEHYLPQVAALLQESATAAIAGQGLDASYKQLFRRLVLAAAWQESCWRQYVISDEKKLVPLRSSTGDVGLMQMNERVWRGFYSQQRLRWEIAYNSMAGSEVLRDYMVRYAMRKGEHRRPGGLANLARASYSAYNGGPSQVARYRDPNASAYGRKVDAAFWDKYQQVAAGNELAVSRCLGGDLAGPASAAGTARQPDRASAASGSGKPAGQFTLQLGVFSTPDNAQAFIRQHGLGAKARVKKRRTSGADQYLVLYGSYATRDQAEGAKRGLAGMQPWIRPMNEL